MAHRVSLETQSWPPESARAIFLTSNKGLPVEWSARSWGTGWEGAGQQSLTAPPRTRGEERTGPYPEQWDFQWLYFKVKISLEDRYQNCSANSRGRITTDKRTLGWRWHLRWKFRSGYKLIKGLGVWKRAFETDVAIGHRSKHLVQVNTGEEKQFIW